MGERCPHCGHKPPEMGPTRIHAAVIAAAVSRHVRETGESYGSIAKRLGWTQAGTNRNTVIGDSTRLKRRLGLSPMRGRYQNTMHYQIAERIVSACSTIDPVDVGL